MKRFLTGDKAWKNKKLRLTLVCALVVILVLVGALVWALTDDDAVKAASGAATPGTSGSSQAGPNQTGSNQAGSNQAGRSDASSGSTSSTTGSQSSTAPNGKVNTWGSVCGLAGSELKPTSQVNMPAMRSKVFVDSTYYYYNNLTGPGKRADGDVPTCYAHSSEGAILAVANFDSLLVGRNRLVDVVKATTYADDGQKNIIDDAQKSSDGASIGLTLLGYSIQVIDENNVIVSIAFQTSLDSSSLFKDTWSVVWDKGDWKLKAPLDGKSKIKQISSVENAGMVPWVN